MEVSPTSEVTLSEVQLTFPESEKTETVTRSANKKKLYKEDKENTPVYN